MQSVLMTALTVGAALTGPMAHAQAVSGLYIGAGAGGNFMGDESYGMSERVGASTTTFRSAAPIRVNTTTTSPSFGTSFHAPLELDAGAAVVASVGYGLGNGLRLEVEADYRYNGFSHSNQAEQKFGGMLNVLYDVPFHPFGATPYVGLGAGYMWVDRGTLPRTDGFAYQAILGGSLPVPWVPGLSATLEYRFMGLAGADHRFTVPGYSSSGPTFSYSQDPSFGKTKFSDDFNHAVMIGLRYAFNAAPPPVQAERPLGHYISDPRTYIIFFDWNRADLTDRARQIISEAARVPLSVQVTRIMLSGNTDTTGAARYNQALSLRRARAVAAELVRDGVPPSVIDAQGFGFSRLLVPTGPGVREPQNRRVEFMFQ